MADRQLMPAIWLRRGEKSTPFTHLGGLPSLPDDVAWPTIPQTDVPLHFLGQVDLASLPVVPMPGTVGNAALPPEGMLFFFIDLHDGIRERESSKVLYTVSAGAERAAPANLPRMSLLDIFAPPEGDCRIFPRVELKAHAVDTYWYSSDDPYGPNGRSGGDITDEAIARVTGKPVDIALEDRSRVQILGYTGGSTEAEEEIEKGHLLLMRFADESLGELLCWEGMVLFWIKPTDLANRAFENAWGMVTAFD